MRMDDVLRLIVNTSDHHEQHIIFHVKEEHCNETQDPRKRYANNADGTMIDSCDEFSFTIICQLFAVKLYKR